MIARGCTINQLEEALTIVNKKYEGNIAWKRPPENLSKNSVRFTLRIKDSRKAGGRRGFNGQRIGISACWHVHGDFFDALFSVCPTALVSSAGKKITLDYGNWEDRNIGSIEEPLYYSEACDCGKNEPTGGNL